jgi:hypothetical protein
LPGPFQGVVDRGHRGRDRQKPMLAIVHDFGGSTGIGHNDGAAAHHGLDLGEGEPLGP